MKHLLLVAFFAVLSIFPFSADAQLRKPNAVDPSELASVIHLDPGLQIVDGYEYPCEDDDNCARIIDTETGQEIRMFQPYQPPIFPAGPVVVSSDLMVNSGQTDTGFVIFFHHLSNGTKIIAYAEPNSPDVEGFHHLGFVDRTLLVYLSYDQPGTVTRRNVIIRIAGDWEGLGIHLPKETQSADLDGNGEVDLTDLLLFRQQWRTATQKTTK